MTDFAKWLLTLIKSLFGAFWDFCTDVVVSILSLFLTAVLAILKTLPLPDFLQQGLGGIISGIPSDVWFFAQHFRLGDALAMFGAAMTFRLARKAATLFQW